ncbi:hypothetical protein A5766_21585 [Gordonia sp. 852002-51296_SCH5728562-b]|nr:hypothetical protein A5766_21585 [Gordonia sp. 852002-51296_SCH5728562-b]
MWLDERGDGSTFPLVELAASVASCRVETTCRRGVVSTSSTSVVALDQRMGTLDQRRRRGVGHAGAPLTLANIR